MSFLVFVKRKLWIISRLQSSTCAKWQALVHSFRTVRQMATCRDCGTNFSQTGSSRERFDESLDSAWSAVAVLGGLSYFKTHFQDLETKDRQQ